MNSYIFDRPKKGRALIINNLFTDHKAQSAKDVKNLTKMFETINVDMDEIQNDQNKNQLNAICENLKKEDLTDINMFFLVVISHGVVGDKMKCYEDDYVFEVERFVKKLGKNPTMNGYPKIFLFYFCRGETMNIGLPRFDVSPKAMVPFGSDIFIGFSTKKGYYAISTPEEGSPFFHHLCPLVETFYIKKTLSYIFQEAQHKVSSFIMPAIDKEGSLVYTTQLPEARSTLTRHLYLMDKGNMIQLTILKICFAPLAQYMVMWQCPPSHPLSYPFNSLAPLSIFSMCYFSLP